MTPQPRTIAACFIAILSPALIPAAVEPGPFFEPEQPFFQTQLQLAPAGDAKIASAGEDIIVRGVVVPLSSGHAFVFDQELLRVAALWVVPAKETPITPETMAQGSYARPRRKAATAHPIPTGELLLEVGPHPGAAVSLVSLFEDPRAPAPSGESGRGPLPDKFGRFSGIELTDASPIFKYEVGGIALREWSESRLPRRNDATGSSSALSWVRHFEIQAHTDPLFVTIGAPQAGAWKIQNGNSAYAVAGDKVFVRAAANSAAVTFSIEHDELVAQVAPSTSAQRISVGLEIVQPRSSLASMSSSPEPLAVAATPKAPLPSSARRWPQSATSSAQLANLSQNGLVLDRIAVPEDNPWNRRVRVADIAFLDANRAAAVTYDGDVWIVSGLTDPGLTHVTWQRFASGLHEPLAIAAPGGVIQVATKNGVVRLHDRDTNGEADWFENFNDQMVQSRTTRSFPLDMAVGPDGSTYVTQGGIVDASGIKSGGTGTVHTGAVLKISPDGRHSETFASHAREPFVAVHPVTGVVTGTDQQGHFIPSSVTYLFRQGDSFGFLQDHPAKLTPPLVWIPHEQDTSSSSQTWMIGSGMGPWNGRLLQLSYGTGRMFLITPDLTAPIPQGSAIPLELKTELPLLHARMSPRGDAVFLVGFQIWGTRASTNWGLGRLRVGPTPVVTAIGARSMSDGVILEFAEPVDVTSLKPENVVVRAWNYQRSREYGSGRYTLEGPAGTNALGVGQIVPANDGRSVFIQLPKLPKIMELEVRHEFRSRTGNPLTGLVYFTINQPRHIDLAASGFPNVDLSKNTVVITQKQEEVATPALGKSLAENLGCVGCHSADGTTEGKVGPTWKNLYGSKRTFVDGTTDTADEIYLRAKILEPMKRRVTTGPAEMPSYRGVVSEGQLDALVLYIKSLRKGRIDE